MYRAALSFCPKYNSSQNIKRKNSLTKKDVSGRRSGRQIKNGDILGSYIDCRCMENPDFESICETDEDQEFLYAAMRIKRIPSPEILRQRLDGIGCSMRSPSFGRIQTCLGKTMQSHQSYRAALSPWI